MITGALCAKLKDVSHYRSYQKRPLDVQNLRRINFLNRMEIKAMYRNPVLLILIYAKP